MGGLGGQDWGAAGGKERTEVTDDDWIPTAQVLPAEGVRVLFWLVLSYIPDGVLCVGTYERNRDEVGRHRWVDQEQDAEGDPLEWRTGDVTHWMYAPEGPRK
jgi:hypothetical protein